MEFDRSYFKDKVAAVTGGASGVGLALCEELLESGAAKVVLADFNKDNLELHEKRLSAQYPGKVKGVLCNVMKKDDVFQMVQAAADFGGGRLDLLINCAGAGLMGKFTESPLKNELSDTLKVFSNDDWKRGFELNFKGPLWGCQAALPIMLRQKQGQIVNIISGIAFSPMAFQSAYAATKSALNALTLALRAEYWDQGIKFNSATPGTTATAIFASNNLEAPPEAQTPHQSAQRILNGVAQNRRLILGDDGDVSGAKHNMLPDEAGAMADQIFLGFARQRAQGKVSFVPDTGAKKPLTPEGQKRRDKLAEICAMGGRDKELIDAKLQEYYNLRDPYAFDHDYYKGKTAAVTGAASGVGYALCEGLLRLGAKSVLLADFNEDRLITAVSALDKRWPNRVKGVVCNVTDEESVKAMIQSAEEFFDGQFDILINCAGVGHGGMFSETSDSAGITRLSGAKVDGPADWERVYAVNFCGPLYGCRAVLPIMLRQGKGQIVNVASGTALVPMPYQAVYSSSKAALNSMTLSLRYEYWDCGVIFNSVTPGTTATPIFGAGQIPLNAQPAGDSAKKVLAGIANNQRLTVGDDPDCGGSITCFNESFQDRMDEITVAIARSRRSGKADEFSGKKN